MNESKRVTCFACGHSYRYLGRGRHPGRCPRCSSHCVSQAGKLLCVADVDIAAPHQPPQVTVMAIDERYRHFLYHFTTDGTRAVLDTVQVEGHLVRAEDVPHSIPVPAPVRDSLAQYGTCLPKDDAARGKRRRGRRAQHLEDRDG